MSGRFMMLDAEQEAPKFSHALFHLDENERLVFQDQRHFGFMNIVKSGRLNETKELAKLAPEPFSQEFSYEYLRALLKSSARNIKQLLLDQTKVCGVGNIYASEALFIAGVRPTIRSNSITRKKADRLRDAIVQVMNATMMIGSKITVDRSNIGGNIYGPDADGEWLVYGRENEECPRCNTPIKRIVQSTRSTFYCKKCQR
jgi:formamidopyrimidine-DNA glycosylase